MFVSAAPIHFACQSRIHNPDCSDAHRPKCFICRAGRLLQARVTQDFDANWLFSKSDFASAMMPAFDDSSWRQVNVPHDWSIEGPFSADYGSGNGYAPGGIGWYRKHFQLDPNQQGPRGHD
jgi:beta-galactosidase